MNGLADILKAIEPLGLPRERVYLRGDVLLLNADCLEVLPLLPSGCVDAVVTDPPYGLFGHNMRRAASMMDVSWDEKPADLSWLVPMGLPSIVWGGNYFHLPPARCVLSWDKNNAGRDFADFELAWTNLDAVARRFIFRPMNMDGGKVHPTQKPVALMLWCLEQLPPVQVIIDPYMGSGTTAIACIQTGRKFIGCELDPAHFATACRRLDAEFERTALLEPPPPRIEQAELFT